MSKILVAHSPDSDDIFMYYAIYFGWVGARDVKFENVALDIESLNRAALHSKYLISAISFGLYPHIAQNYALLNTAMSFGEGYGPKLIKRKNVNLKHHFKVALSGEFTTNALIFRIMYPHAKIIYKNFLDIEQSVKNSEVDAGVLIHESILEIDSELEVEAHLWDMWRDLVRDDLPLPLGGMAILRSIPLLRALKCQEILQNAVRVAVHNKKILSKMLESRVRIDAKKLEVYLNMYANEDSINLNERQIHALNALFRLGYENGFYQNKIDAHDVLLPSDYANLRFS